MIRREYSLEVEGLEFDFSFKREVDGIENLSRGQSGSMA